MPKPVAFWYVLTSGLQVKRPIRKRVAFWYVLASGLQVKRPIGKPQLLTLNRSKEDGYEKEVEGSWKFDGAGQAPSGLCRRTGGGKGTRWHMLGKYRL